MGGKGDYAAVKREWERMGARIEELERCVREGEARLRDLDPLIARLRREQQDKRASRIAAERTRTERAIAADTKALLRLSKDRTLLRAKLHNLRR